MSVVEQSVPQREDTDTGPILHIYPERLAGGIPEPGDKALCGWVKKTSPHLRPLGAATCVVCLSIFQDAR